ncbi:MAG TPA: hypothetical protein VFI42_08035, partial [Thermomicrobiaceae bacterium]|nr:hypothetical protein [Thermomicrobiaceae bacterium]
MRQPLRRLAAAGLLAVTVLAGAGIGASAADGAGISANGINAATDGQSVVWAAPAGEQHDILIDSVGGHQRRTVADGPRDQTMPAVSGSVVVWAEWTGTGVAGQRDLLGTDLASGAAYTIAAGDTDEHDPSIWQQQVVWVSTAFDEQTHSLIDTLLLKDLGSNAAPVVLDQAPSEPGSSGIFEPVINDGRVVWLNALKSTTHSSAWTLKLRRLGDTAPVEIASGFFAIGGPSASLAPLDRPGFDIAGNTLVYSTNFDVYALDLASQAKTQLAGVENGAWLPGGNPTTNGRYVFWQDYRYSADSADLARQLHSASFRADIAGYDLQSHSQFAVTTNTGYNANPMARGGTLVYEQRADPSDQVAEIEVTPVSAVLPTAPQPNPGKTSPNWFYFTETQHYLSFGFKTFWQESGGVPVFGFPLTEEFSELNPDLDRMLTVQYLERQRYEYHPEHAGTPYEVELGRLGAEDAAARNLGGTAPFTAVDASTAGEGCEYVAATGHTLCGAFRDYWHAHGLELGDRGLSARESLALFGYPLSEPFTDPDTDVTVQYFERARFESHPENPPGWQVLLGR